MPNPGTRQRLFFALCPDDAIRRELASIACGSLPKQGRLVAVENLHLTLLFLGAIGCEHRECIELMASDVRSEPFVVRVDHLGYWPRPRILWSAPSELPSSLMNLAQQLGVGVTSCGLSLETRPFTPHITLARKVSVGRFKPQHPPVVWYVDAFHLLESRTSQAGVKYQRVATWPLANQGAIAS